MTTEAEKMFQDAVNIATKLHEMKNELEADGGDEIKFAMKRGVVMGLTWARDFYAFHMGIDEFGAKMSGFMRAVDSQIEKIKAT